MLYIFDMGGVVTTTAGELLYRNISSKLSISYQEFMDYCCKSSYGDLLHQLDIGKITSKEFWNIFSDISGIKVYTDFFRVLFHPKCIQETYCIIKELKASGNRVVCGTNTIDSHYDNHLSRGDYSIFDMTYTSIHLGVAKPDPEFWNMILDFENEKPQNTFFTDDNLTNINAANQLGIRTYLFDNPGGLRKAINIL